jgi:hypothetical protein
LFEFGGGAADLTCVVAGAPEFLAAQSALIATLTGTELHEDQLAFIGSSPAILPGEPVVNRVATLIAKAHGFVWQRYVGAVVFTSVDDEGETQSLREGHVEALLTTARLGGAVVVDATVDEAEVGA